MTEYLYNVLKEFLEELGANNMLPEAPSFFIYVKTNDAKFLSEEKVRESYHVVTQMFFLCYWA